MPRKKFRQQKDRFTLQHKLIFTCSKKCSLSKVLELGYFVTYLVTTMRNPLLQPLIEGAVVLLLVIGVMVLAGIDPSTRPMFGDLTKFVVGGYIGRLSISTPNKRRQQRQPALIKRAEFPRLVVKLEFVEQLAAGVTGLISSSGG